MASTINWQNVGTVQRSFETVPRHSVSNEGIADFMNAVTDVVAAGSRKEAVDSQNDSELASLEAELADLEREKASLEAQLAGSNFVHGSEQPSRYGADRAALIMAGFNPQLDTGRM